MGKYIQMANMFMKRCLALLVIREMQFNAAMNLTHFIPIEWLKLKLDSIKCYDYFGKFFDDFL